MQFPNCPRCNSYLAPGAQVCPNCQLNLQQMHYQQPPVNMQGAAPIAAESGKEKTYRILLVVIALVTMGEFLIFRLPSWASRWFGMSVYSWTKPFEWLLSIGWAGLPLLIAILLPKKNSARVVLIVFASIFALWKLVAFVYDQFVFDPWQNYGGYPPVNYNF